MKRIGIKKSGGLEQACALVEKELATRSEPTARYTRSINSGEVTIFNIRKWRDYFIVERPSDPNERTQEHSLNAAFIKQVHLMVAAYGERHRDKPISELQALSKVYFETGAFLLPKA